MSSNLPGRWLLAIGRLLFDGSVYDAAVVPAVADMQAEWIAAATGRERLLARWRGFLAFVSLVVISPVAFRGWPGRDRGDGAPVITLVGLVVAGLALWQWWIPVAQAIEQILLAGEQSSWALAAWAATLAGPVLTGGYLLLRRHAPENGDGIFPILLAMALLSIALPLFFGAAAVISTFSGIGERGSAGLGIVLKGLRAATLPAFYGLLAAVLSLLFVVRLAFEPRPLANRPSLSGVSAMSLTLLGSVILVALHVVMQLHHRVMQFGLAVFAPIQQRPYPGGSAAIAHESEYVVHLMLAAILLAGVVMLFAITTWRAVRDRRPPSWFIWVARAAVVIALIGTAWHTTIAYRQMREMTRIMKDMH